MGYASLLSACFACGRTFASHPTRVPVIVVDGERHPVCERCLDRANLLRVNLCRHCRQPLADHTAGVDHAAEAFEPHPKLAGAYDVADEAEL